MYITLQNCVDWDSKTLILSLKNNNFSDYDSCQGGKTISSIWRFDRPSCSSCRLCTALILDPATKNNCFYVNRKAFKNKIPKDFYVPPLLKSLSAHGRILIKSLVLLSKSEWFYDLGAGLIFQLFFYLFYSVNYYCVFTINSQRAKGLLSKFHCLNMVYYHFLLISRMHITTLRVLKVKLVNMQSFKC